MDTLTVHFVRHASGTHMLQPEIIAGHSLDAELTDIGQTEAYQKGLQLGADGFRPDAIVCSTAVRCRQTAQWILKGMGSELSVMETPEILEMDQGRNAGRLRDEVYNEATVQEILLRGKDFAPLNGESMNQVGKRGLDWLKTQERYARPGGFSVLAVTHTGFIACTVGMLQGLGHAETRALFKKTPPVGEVVLQFANGGWQVEGWH